MRIEQFFEYLDESGLTNREKIRKYQQVIRRVPETDASVSYEQVSASAPGTVYKDGKLIGFGINILNEDIYPIQSFEIYLRNCHLSGSLDLSGNADLLFVDLYHNELTGINVRGLRQLRILGIQDNRIESLDPQDLVACQGIDAGRNRLKEISLTHNHELVELYLNDNRIGQLDVSPCTKLQYLYVQNNCLTHLDLRQLAPLKHLNATGNPLTAIYAWAPLQERQPLFVTASTGGTVGLRFNPIYNAQWKETGKYEQCYVATPMEGYHFSFWMSESRERLSEQQTWVDTYGSSRIIQAVFEKN